MSKAPFSLDPLPFGYKDLEPIISAETISYHYDKHHQSYVVKLNQLVQENKQLLSRSKVPLETIEDLVVRFNEYKHQGIYNNAAQIWNHSFYWKSLTKPNTVQKNLMAFPLLSKAITMSFGSYEEFKKKFEAEGLSHFGSGWVWLCYKYDTTKHTPLIDELQIISTHDADTPLTHFLQNKNGIKLVPIVTCDVWEHAYYVDYRNERARYLKSFFELINFEFMEQQLKQAPAAWVTRNEKIQSSL